MNGGVFRACAIIHIKGFDVLVSFAGTITESTLEGLLELNYETSVLLETGYELYSSSQASEMGLLILGCLKCREKQGLISVYEISSGTLQLVAELQGEQIRSDDGSL